MRHFLSAVTIALAFAVPVLTTPIMAMPDSNSRPEPPARSPASGVEWDRSFPGTMALKIDATDVTRGIFRIEQTIPVERSGEIVLRYPEWLPGNHAPRGELEKVAGLRFEGGGKALSWHRDPYDAYAFLVDVPEGVDEVTARFEFLSATDPEQGRVVVAPKMLNLRWHQLSLYPAGYFARDIPVVASVSYPEGWQAATALSGTQGGEKKGSGNRVTYEETDYDTLVDSPVFAGAYFKQWQLTDKVALNVVADAPEFLAASEAQIETHRRLVREAVALFGTQHYDHYDFLLALTEEMGGIGIEHHRSSENGVDTGYFTDWNDGPGRRNLLAHEMTHSWNGKYRRPAGIWTPDYSTYKDTRLLWVYEGQTQFWGYVLGARSGLFTRQQTLDAWAYIAAAYDQRTGRDWRPLIDTTYDPVISSRKPKAWTSWQRQEDYYNEGLLIWLEADGIIRRESNGTKSLEDFARRFFGGKEGDWGVDTYELEDVVADLNAVQPYDWADFLQDRVYRTTDAAPKNGLALGGYRLVFSDKPNSAIAASEKRGSYSDLSFGMGLYVEGSGAISGVIWDSPAFEAGLTEGQEIVAVNGEEFSAARLKQAIRDAASGDGKIELVVKRFERVGNVSVSYAGGLRYPALEKMEDAEGSINRLLAPKAQ